MKAVFAGGCFWCTEAIFKRLRGVISVQPGYAGGVSENPTYEAVSTGLTGHAEAIEIEYDPSIISYEKLLTIFFHSHDPTTLNRQGSDIGTQYRSAVFTASETEKEIAGRVMRTLENEKVYPNKIITEIVPFTNFYPAEDPHRDYYDRNTDQGYCTLVISPKIAKLLKEFAGDVQDEFLK